MATDPLCITPKTVVACKLSKVVIAIIYAVNENLFQPVLTLSAGSGTFVALRLVAAITIIVFGIVVETFLSFLLSCNIIQLYLMGLKYFIQRFIPQDSIGNIQFRTGQSGFKFIEGMLSSATSVMRILYLNIHLTRWLNKPFVRNDFRNGLM